MVNEDIMKEVMVESAKQVTEEVYHDAIQSTAKNVGGFFGTLSGFFNHVVMYPLKKLNIKYEQKAIAFEREMEEKYNKIPDENKCEPKINVIGPALEALKYNMLEEDLRNLFKNLLVNSMDIRKQHLCLPAYIKLIEQMSSVDAYLFSKLYNKCLNFGIVYICAQATITYPKGFGVLECYPKYLIAELFEKYTLQEISISLSNLIRLGLLTIKPSAFMLDEYVNNILFRNDVKELFNKRKIYYDSIPNSNSELKTDVIEKGIIGSNDFAYNFAKICLEE